MAFRAILALLSVSAASLGGGVLFSSLIDMGPSVQAEVRRAIPLASVSAEGIVEGARPEVAVRTETSGILSRLLVKENQRVRKGELLVELSNATQQGQAALARAELKIARADLDRVRNGERKEKRRAVAALVQARRALFEQASADLKRSRAITLRGAGSHEDYEHKQTAVNQARAELENALAEKALIDAEARIEDMQAAQGRVAVAQARVQMTEADLAKTRLQAPCDGVILRIFAEPGEVTGPATPQPILILADLSRLRVRAFIEELDIAGVRVGQDAMVTAEGFPGKEFRGKVNVVLPRMGKRAPQSDQPNEYKDLYFQEVLINLEPGAPLPVNLRVRVKIMAAEGGVR